MKNIVHHAIIVTSRNLIRLNSIREKCVDLMNSKISSKQAASMISATLPSISNQFQSFIIIPDGSKENYDISDEADNARSNVVEFLNGLDNSDSDTAIRFVEVSYGTDTNHANVLNHN